MRYQIYGDWLLNYLLPITRKAVANKDEATLKLIMENLKEIDLTALRQQFVF